MKPESEVKAQIVLHEKRFMKIIEEEVKFPWSKGNPQDIKDMKRAIVRAFKEGAITFEEADT
ncbi:hypothetical protein ES703_83231 [subsurface metagenome]